MQPRSARINKQGLFSPQIPMKKSILISDQFYTQDLNKSAVTIKPSYVRTPESKSLNKSSSIFIIAVSYPGSNFLVKKLKRIVYFYLQRSFNKIKNHRKQIINLNILNSFHKRVLACALFSIKIIAQTNRQSKQQDIIKRNKKPDLLLYSLGRLVRKNKKQVIKQMKKNTIRKKRIQIFINILVNCVKSYQKSQCKIFFFRQLKSLQQRSLLKIEATKNILRFIPKIIKKVKFNGFKQILSGLKIQKLQNTQTVKKKVSTKLSENSASRVKVLNSERQKIRDMKNYIDSSASDRSKARFQLRKDLNALRHKLKQEQKKSKTFVQSINLTNCKLSAELAQLQQLNSKRLTRIQSKVTEQVVKSLYTTIQKQQQNQIGQIKLKGIEKSKLAAYQQQLQKTDQFHIYMNQKLRQQLYQYENIVSSKQLFPHQQLIFQQNINLKEMIACMVQRALQNHTVGPLFKQTQQ